MESNVEFWRNVILVFVAFVCGSGGLALIEFLREKWKFKAERTAVKEDRKEEKTDKLEKLSKQVEELSLKESETARMLNTQKEALKCILLDRIIHLGQSYIREGVIDFDDRRRLREMHDSYHKGLGGNGDADAIMKAIDQLPLKNNNN